MILADEYWLVGRSEFPSKQPEVALNECGECRTHNDCNVDEICKHQMNGTEYANICISEKCVPGEASSNGVCNDNGEWNCNHGWTGDACEELGPCEERCLNGAKQNCVASTDECKCENGYGGDFCELHPCNPG